MPLTASLSIDIEDFEKGLRDAQVTLQTFERAASRVSRDLQRLVEGFSGERVIVESERMARAVELVGGASRLTDAEQRRVNTTVSEAIQKYARLGQEAPAHLLALQRATAGAAQQTSVLTRGAQLLVGVFSARAVLNMAGDVLELTGKLSDLSAKTGISATALQSFQFVMGQSGVSLDQVANAAVRLGRNLIEGDKSAVGAVEKLHLRVSDLIAAGPERAFLQIGQAVAQVPNPMERAALAVELFGKTGAELLPGFSADMADVAEQARAAGLFLGEDLVAGGDRAGDALFRLKSIGLSLMGQLLIPMLPAIETVANWLGSALPAALNTARSAFDNLLRTGIQFRAWLYDLAATVSQTVRDVPVLGRVFGQSAADIAGLRAEAQHARDALDAFNIQGVQPSTRAAQQAAPVLSQYGEAHEKVARAAKKAGDAIKDELIGPLEEQGGLLTRSIAKTGELTRALESWARVNSAVLAPSIEQINASLEEQLPLINSAELVWAQFPATVQQSTTTASSGIGGFFQRIFGDSQTLGQNISNIFQAAFTGGGGALGAVQAFATQALSALFNMIPGVGQFLSAFAGPIVAMLSRLGRQVGDFFRQLFGGPSRDELNGRNLVNEFETNIIGLLSAQQQAEAGGERWRQVVIGIRDAYLANGLSAAEAEADVARLWASSKDGAEASRRVIDEINAKLHRVGDTASDVTEDTGDTATSVSDSVEETAKSAEQSIEKISRALDGLPEVVDIEIRPRYTDPEGNPVRQGDEGSTTLSAVMGSAALRPAMPNTAVATSRRVGGATIRIPVYLDGRQVAESMAPHLPSALNFMGVRSATWP